MGLLLHVSGLRIRHGLSIIGISIAGAFSHNMIQLFLAYLILIKHSGIFIFFPWLSVGALVMGYMVGIVSRGVCRNLERLEDSSRDDIAYIIVLKDGRVVKSANLPLFAEVADDEQ